MASNLVSGKISWFGGPNDPTTGPTTASGAPVSNPGIAVYNRATLGGWWLMKLPNGLLSVIQQTDIGPAPSTGRTFDFTYGTLPALGYSQNNFPTGATVSGVYLGKTNAEIGSTLQSAVNDLGGNLPNIAGWLNTVFTKNGPKFGVSTATGSHIGPIDTGALDTGNQPVQTSGPSNVVTSVGGSLGQIASLVTSTSFWLRIGEGIAAILLIYLGLHALTGQSSTAGQQVKHVTRIIPV